MFDKKRGMFDKKTGILIKKTGFFNGNDIQPVY
jgi:hypothetical protein